MDIVMKMDDIQTLAAKFNGRLGHSQAELAEAASDYGHIVHQRPLAVLKPDSIADVCQIVRLARQHKLKVVARGQGASTHGQSQAEQGIVIDMRSLARVHEITTTEALVDAGITWDVLLPQTLARGLTPPILIDFLDVTVGGTISVGGVGAQTFKVGTQADNVLALEVVTGEGELVTCSAVQHADLFNACRAGLGQFGIIVKARLSLVEAPTHVRFYRLLYKDLGQFLKRLQTLADERQFDGVEGFVMPNSQMALGQVIGPAFKKFGGVTAVLDKVMAADGQTRAGRPRRGLASSWGPLVWKAFRRSLKMGLLPSAYDTGRWLFLIEAAKYFTPGGEPEDGRLVADLSELPGNGFIQDMAYLKYARRLDRMVMAFKFMGVWSQPHPWINLMIPAEHTYDFAGRLLEALTVDDLGQGGSILVYPYNRAEFKAPFFRVPQARQVFKLGFMRNTSPPTPERIQEIVAANRGLYEQCLALGGTRYPIDSVPMTQADWARHFGPAWPDFVAAKQRYDPDNLLAPNQNIF